MGCVVVAKFEPFITTKIIFPIRIRNIQDKGMQYYYDVFESLKCWHRNEIQDIITLIQSDEKETKHTYILPLGRLCSYDM